MPSSAASRPSVASNRQRAGPTPLPAYQPSQHPLNENAIRAIQDLHRNHRFDGLKTRLKAANNHLSGAAVDINDQLVAQIALHDKTRARREKQGSQEENEEEARAMDAKRQKTDEMTNRLEVGVRKIVDAKFEVESVESALRELETNVANNRGAIAPTQSTLGASQFRSNRRRRGGDPDSEDSNVEDDSETAGENGSALDFIKTKIAEQKSAYQNETMSFRYAQNNDYVGFKKLVYDAQFPGDDAPPMPHSSTWFSDASAHGSDPHARGGAKAAGDQSAIDDDDLAVASERISIKCPITLLPMKDPVTSTKCPHSFEREAILSMINASDARVDASGGRGGGGRKAMQCPVCTVMLTADDVAANPVLVRKIQRIQAAEDAQIQGDSDDDDDDDVRAPASSRRRPEEISSSPARMRTPHVKNERRSQALRNMSREVSMVPNSQVQELVRGERGRPSSSAATDVVDLEEDEDEDMEE